MAEGHKTGFYLDQRDSRKLFADTVRHFGYQRVLNCYCYTGGFSVAALAGGAGHVTSVDSSAPALARATAHVALNGFDARATHARRPREPDLRGACSKAPLRPPCSPTKFAPNANTPARRARLQASTAWPYALNRLRVVPFVFRPASAPTSHKIVAGAEARAKRWPVYARPAPHDTDVGDLPRRRLLQGLLASSAEGPRPPRASAGRCRVELRAVQLKKA